jgi:hypothetical protein
MGFGFGERQVNCRRTSTLKNWNIDEQGHVKASIQMAQVVIWGCSE